jgi:Putative MetA-pathway of phenol degradation
MKKLFFILITSLSAAFAQFEGAFINHDAGGFVGAEVGYQGYDRVLTKDSLYNGNLRRSVSDVTIRLFAHYSPIEKLSLFVSVPLKIVSSNENYTTLLTNFPDTLPSNSLFNVGNVQFGVKYKFFHKKEWLLAASVLSEFKTSYYEDKDGLKTGLEAFSFNPNFHVAKTFKEKYYINLDLGGTYRTDDHSGDARIYAEVGTNFWKEQIWLRLGFDVRQSFRNGNFLYPNNRQTGLYLNDREYLGIVFRAEYNHPVGVGFYAGVNAYFNADNIPAFPYVNGGIFYRWKYDLRQELPYKIIPMETTTN